MGATCSCHAESPRVWVVLLVAEDKSVVIHAPTFPSQAEAIAEAALLHQQGRVLVAHAQVCLDQAIEVTPAAAAVCDVSADSRERANVVPALDAPQNNPWQAPL